MRNGHFIDIDWTFEKRLQRSFLYYKIIKKILISFWGTIFLVYFKFATNYATFNGFARRQSAYYIITTPFLKEPWNDKKKWDKFFIIVEFWKMNETR